MGGMFSKGPGGKAMPSAAWMKSSNPTGFAKLQSSQGSNPDFKSWLSAGSFKRGGKVKKTGLAKVHKGERVLTKKQAEKLAKKAPKKMAKRHAKRHSKRSRKN